MRDAWQRADKSKLVPPPPETLIGPDWQPIEPATRALVERGHSYRKQISIGE